jgi:hypothetical protein
MNEPKAAWPFPNYEKPEPGQLNREAALSWILKERKRQTFKWSLEHDDTHTFSDWKTIIQELIEDEMPPHETLIRIAATALAALEAHIRDLDKE